jgi:hypothetical protein
MGKTVQIDDDVLAAAEKIAAERGGTPGEVISDAARTALVKQGVLDEKGPAGAVLKNGWWVLPHRDGPPMSAAAIERLIRETEREDDARRGGSA